MLACRLRVLVINAVVVYGPIELWYYFFDWPNSIKMPLHVIILVVIMFQSSKLIYHLEWLFSIILGQE
jgi:hypothetical protein